ncbi:uncharacterized protein MONOS_1398 [Monocercomonoides exilis]|uniref:uncharacterized protein n=1 Tax=Monocercomonoides exilis TaxID=2049356 RepID=UPI00355990CB|nr:hypothetical protein MONOS_1398 [Monocercomonoides exilis]|eukprot:MONOS_1398.1-p1 / transcript=MONOS_1398.1 / gene=MONOS_1398 / organism=Monocercomonoides_exilis_PA203 / gene_product=unspecified product / transcript_product=unspecified product / location=Mono_scaffold00024:117155-117610(+) / protein_length=134 / sequence_SO=supercontig / SO=protein_coding / is_pseudo=false
MFDPDLTTWKNLKSTEKHLNTRTMELMQLAEHPEMYLDHPLLQAFQLLKYSECADEEQKNLKYEDFTEQKLTCPDSFSPQKWSKRFSDLTAKFNALPPSRIPSDLLDCLPAEKAHQQSAKKELENLYSNRMDA